MKFDYLKQPFSALPNKPYISRPIIPIRIVHQQKYAELFALVDSGADVSLFHSDIARDLGIDLRQADTMVFGGIAEAAVLAYVAQIQLQIVGAKQTISMLAAFTDSQAVDAILGQEGFFEHYQIKFEKYIERLEIKPKRRGLRK